MGKESKAKQQKQRPQRQRAEEVVSREYTVNLHKRLHGVFVSLHTYTNTIRIHTHT